jgi:Flp pilus assembly protein TadD
LIARLFSLAALVVALAPVTSSAETDLDALLSRAVVLHQTGDLEGAAGLYVQVLRAQPGAYRIRSNLGAVYAGLGRFDEAIGEYRRALESADDPAIRQNLALSLQKAGRPREAADEAARVLAARPGDRGASLLMADALLRLGEDARVVVLLQPLAASAQDDKAVAYLLGTALLNLDRAAEAQTVMDRVFRDSSPEAHVLLGALHAKRNDWAKALAEYEKARALDPKLPLVNYLYGEALMRERNDWEAAAAAFRAELELDRNHFESNLLLGNLLRQGGQNEEAVPLLERAARLRGDDVAVKYSLGVAYLAAGRAAEARRLLEDVAAASPNHMNTQMKLAVVYIQLGMKQEAARARANAARLQHQADAEAFQGVRESIGELLNRPVPEAAAPKEP